MTIDKQGLKALVARVKTDRRFCADDHHQVLADGVQSLLAESEMLTAQRLMHVRLNLSLRARRKVWVSACEKAEDQLLDALAERDQLKAENEALRKDAERWKWLEGSADAATWESIGCQAEMNRHLHVDAAMAKEASRD